MKWIPRLVGAAAVAALAVLLPRMVAGQACAGMDDPIDACRQLVVPIVIALECWLVFLVAAIVLLRRGRLQLRPLRNGLWTRSWPSTVDPALDLRGWDDYSGGAPPAG